MSASVFYTNCPGCRQSNSVRIVPGQRETACWRCHRAVTSALFPALLPKPPPMPPGPGDMPAEGDMVCFYNPQRKATTSCDQCGVYISDAWKAKWGAKTLCLRCLDKLHAEKRGTQFENSRVMWDNIVLMLALVPMTGILWVFGFFTAPIAMFLGIWAWKKPTSLVPRGKARMAIGLTLASLQVVGIIFFIYTLVSSFAAT